MSDVNDQVITEFRANAGDVQEAMGGHFKNVELLLLHDVGRKSGREFVHPLLYLAHEDSYLLVGSAGGAPEEPAWVGNLAAMQEVTIEVGGRTLTATPAVLREGPERDRLYAALVDYWPDLREYETHTTRTFPVVRLDPAE
jgi:deazaflavin-dependent oxidoreductase (nitroreductase family)